MNKCRRPPLALLSILAMAAAPRLNGQGEPLMTIRHSKAQELVAEAQCCPVSYSKEEYGKTVACIASAIDRHCESLTSAEISEQFVWIAQSDALNNGESLLDAMASCYFENAALKKDYIVLETVLSRSRIESSFWTPIEYTLYVNGCFEILFDIAKFHGGEARKLAIRRISAAFGLPRCFLDDAAQFEIAALHQWFVSRRDLLHTNHEYAMDKSHDDESVGKDAVVPLWMELLKK